MFKRILTTTVSLVALAAAVHQASAADLPTRPAYAQPPIMSPVPVYNWTGIYIGANGGYGWGNQDPLDLITNRFDGQTLGFSGGVFGGTIGAQIQSGHVVLGFEADLDWANMKGSGVIYPTIGGVPQTVAGINASTNIDWESTARVRVGYANQNWLFYATGGMAILGAKTSLTTTGGASCASLIATCTGASKQIGAALGAGVEYGFTPEISAKLEYLYITAASLDISHHSEIRMGLNYRFGGN